MSESQTTHGHDATAGSAVPAPRRRRTKLGIVGAGAVGATLAYASLMRGAAQTVALYDINGAKVRAEALDLAHGIQFMPMAEVEGSDDVAVLRRQRRHRLHRRRQAEARPVAPRPRRDDHRASSRRSCRGSSRSRPTPCTSW